MSGPVPPGPVPFETNPEVNAQYYQPSNFIISNITSSKPNAVVTTTDDHNYVVGQLIRFHIPIGWGIRQLNEQLAYVSVINSDTSFTAQIDISKYDSFVTPPHSFQSPQVSAIGDENFGWSFDGSSFSPMNELAPPGAFINISPAPNGVLNNG